MIGDDIAYQIAKIIFKAESTIGLIKIVPKLDWASSISHSYAGIENEMVIVIDLSR